MIERMGVVPRFILEFLSDGKWHEHEEVVQVAMPITPPGVAIRLVEQRRSSNKGAPKKRKRPMTTSQQIASGQRSAAVTAINSLVDVGRVERVITDDKKMVRLCKPFHRVLIVREKGELEAYKTASEVSISVFDLDAFRTMSREELEEADRELKTFRRDFPGVTRVRNELNVALALRRHERTWA